MGAAAPAGGGPGCSRSPTAPFAPGTRGAPSPQSGLSDPVPGTVSVLWGSPSSQPPLGCADTGAPLLGSHSPALCCAVLCSGRSHWCEQVAALLLAPCSSHHHSAAEGMARSCKVTQQHHLSVHRTPHPGESGRRTMAARRRPSPPSSACSRCIDGHTAGMHPPCPFGTARGSTPTAPRPSLRRGLFWGAEVTCTQALKSHPSACAASPVPQSVTTRELSLSRQSSPTRAVPDAFPALRCGAASTAGHTGSGAHQAQPLQKLDLSSCADFIKRSASAGAAAHPDAQGHLPHGALSLIHI